MPHSTLEVFNLSKAFQKQMLFENVNLQIHSGEICALVGKNGMGKTIFLKCILGYEPFDDGEVTIAGHQLNNREQIRLHSAYIPSDGHDLCDLLTPLEYYRFIIAVYQLPEKETLLYASELSVQLGIESHLERLMKELSFGTKKKALLLGALLYDPALLICDEIFEGLDQSSVEAVISLFQERARNNRSVLFTTHLQDLLEAVSTVVYRIENNQIMQIAK
ncbi:ATP-binding cassette domain-containing protein [Paenibacillus popilliae]|uniref:ATP-binding cassette domain-containing protein n=1 Tax=Paenibacillus popilliae TaxID=78057 RepID=A0ABY3ATV1_PAEPP|nr:ATP-binding cassette domain-containing protein [Paenibacillus sp. SDF0028]TQR46153.1 ATP-binding cassette domain-containing protein [Paenibacillus sp. SDF0028]